MVHRFRRIHGVIAALLLPLVLLSASTQSPAQEPLEEQSTAQLFNRAIQKFQEGNYSADEGGALYYLRAIRSKVRATSGGPAEEAEMVAELIRLAEQENVLLSMRNAGGAGTAEGREIAAFVDWMSTTYFRTGREVNPSQQQVVQAIRTALASNRPEPIRNLLRYRAHVVAALVEMGKLRTSLDTEAIRVQDIQTALGTDAVLPLVQMLKSSVDIEQMRAAVALGNIGDSRAIPGLVALVESEESGSDVEQAALSALRRPALLGTIDTRDDLPSSVSLYYSLALSYYRGRPAVINSLRGNGFILWSYGTVGDSGATRSRLQAIDVPQWAFLNSYAEQACLAGLESLAIKRGNAAGGMGSLSPEDESTGSQAWDLFVAVSLDQYLESKRRLSMDPSSEQARMMIEQYHRGRLVSSAAGEAALYRAIDRSISNRRYEVAIAAMHIIREMGTTIGLPSPADFNPDGTPNSSKASVALIRALTYPSYKPVRFAAAQTLFSLSSRYRGGQDSFYLMEAARDILIEGLGVSEQRTILVVTSNLDLTNDMRAKLLRLGYNARFAPTGSQGFNLATTTPFDLILVDAEMVNDNVDLVDANQPNDGSTRTDIFDALGDDVRTEEIPVYVLVDRSQRSDPRTIVNDASFRPYFANGIIDDIIGYSENALPALTTEIAQFDAAWEQASEFDDSADEIAIQSAHALMGWNFGAMEDTSFFRPFVPALLERVTSDSQTQVKLAMLDLLAEFVRSNNRQAFPTSLFNGTNAGGEEGAAINLVDVLHSVLFESTADYAPSVKERACQVLAEFYRSHAVVGGNTNAPRWETDYRPMMNDFANRRRATESLFEATLALLTYDPLADEDVELADSTRDEVTRDLHQQILAVRTAAAELLGAAPLNQEQALLVAQANAVHANGSGE